MDRDSEAAKGRAANLAERKAALDSATQKRLEDPLGHESHVHGANDARGGECAAARNAHSGRLGHHAGRGTFSDLLRRAGHGVVGERGGALGWGMGGALGLKLANPDRPVVGIIGDGSSMMTVQSLWTAADLQHPGRLYHL